MKQELLKLADIADGVRCDMAMLILPEVFRRTWGEHSLPPDGAEPLNEPFWPEATAQVKAKKPQFIFMAEVYWDLEWELMQQGFDYCYDKKLYDRLLAQDAAAVRSHLWADLAYQNKLARFLENHDEPRAAATFLPGRHEAAAVVTYLAPGLRFFHQGQFDGRVKRISPHLVRGPDEPVNPTVRQFYEWLTELLRRPVVRGGEWRALDCSPAWDGNRSAEAIIAYAWQNSDGNRLIVSVNYADHQSQCYVRLPFAGLAGGRWRLRDLLGTAQYDRDGDELQSRGLYLDVPPWQGQVFETTGV